MERPLPCQIPCCVYPSSTESPWPDCKTEATSSLPDSKWNTHRPGRQGLMRAFEPAKAGKTRCQVPQADAKHGSRAKKRLDTKAKFPGLKYSGSTGPATSRRLWRGPDQHGRQQDARHDSGAGTARTAAWVISFAETIVAPCAPASRSPKRTCKRRVRPSRTQMARKFGYVHVRRAETSVPAQPRRPRPICRFAALRSRAVAAELCSNAPLAWDGTDLGQRLAQLGHSTPLVASPGKV